MREITAYNTTIVLSTNCFMHHIISALTAIKNSILSKNFTCYSIQRDMLLSLAAKDLVTLKLLGICLVFLQRALTNTVRSIPDTELRSSEVLRGKLLAAALSNAL